MQLVDMSQLVTFFALFSIGYVFLKVAFGLINFIRIYFTGTCPKFESYGSWSVVTGSTDGIGLAYARELARCGQKIVLISRNSEKLSITAKNIEKEFNVETLTVAVDFSKSKIYNYIKDQLKGLDIGVLVNNVGRSHLPVEHFFDLPNCSEVIDQLISVNINSVVKMTEIVLPQMVLKRKGIILNLASRTAISPSPMLSLYCATKQFVDSFSIAVAEEYKNHKIIVQSVIPELVATKMTHISKASLAIPSPETYVKSSLKTIGKTYRTFGYVYHAIDIAITLSFPTSIYMWITCAFLKRRKKQILKNLNSEKK